MRSLEWIYLTAILIKTEIWTQTCTEINDMKTQGEGDMQTEAEIIIMPPQAKEHQGWMATT